MVCSEGECDMGRFEAAGGHLDVRALLMLVMRDSCGIHKDRNGAVYPGCRSILGRVTVAETWM